MYTTISLSESQRSIRVIVVAVSYRKGDIAKILRVMREAQIVAGIAAVLLWLQPYSASTQSRDVNTNVAPYLLFATTARIYRMNLNGSDREELVHEQNNGILGLEYHYRLNLLFWTNVLEPSIKQANLNGSNIRRIVTNDGPDDLALDYPVDLAVDWINNKLYWTDRDVKIIGVYDLVTAERRVILSTGGTNSLPFGLAVYPFPDYGWLYWVDRGKKTLEVAAVTGEGREVLESGRRVDCAWPLTLDYSEHTIYWLNHCNLRLTSINMDGSQRTMSISVRNIFFPYGISILNDTIFWTQSLSAFSADKTQGEPSTEIATTPSNEGGARGIEAVHPLQQPAAEVFREIVDTGTAVCDPPCANGDCINPGLCLCDRGWTGLDCLTDANECVISNGGCDHSCINLVGSHECSCIEGYELGNDTRSCEDINECDTANGDCQQRCVNSLGSYECVCFDGFVLNETMTCEDINECENSNGGCDYNCTNLEGSYECTCPEELTIDVDDRRCACLAGFAFNDNATCEDVNECEISNGGCDYICTNSEGSYECSCVADLVLGADGRSCGCIEGYVTKDNITCEDVNECEISNGGCDHNCTNSEGSYECSCVADLVLGADGRSCGCIEGYVTKDNITCEDVNECEISNGGCDHNCTNSEGSYECSCVADLVLGADGRSCGCIEGYVTKDNITCEDVNECNNSNGGCTHNCTNLEGSYECSCPDGFVLDLDGRSCKIKASTDVVEIAISPTSTAASTTHTVETSQVLETSRLHTTVPAVIMSSFVSNPQQSSIPSPVRTTQPVPSSKENTVLSSSSTSTTTSNIRMLSTAFVGTAIPTTGTTEASDTSSKSRTIPSSTSTTHTSPSTSMGSSPSPDITEPEPDSSTMLVIVAAAASAGVIAVAVVMVIIAIIAYRWRAHRSKSWSPPRSTGDSPTDSIKYTTSTVTTASPAVDSNGTS